MDSSNKNKKALQDLRNVLLKAEEGGYLHQIWTLIEAMRGPDATPEEGKASLKDNYITPVRKGVLTQSMALKLGVSGAKEFGIVPYDHIWINDIFPIKRNHARRHAISAGRIINASKGI